MLGRLALVVARHQWRVTHRVEGCNHATDPECHAPPTHARTMAGLGLIQYRDGRVIQSGTGTYAVLARRGS